MSLQELSKKSNLSYSYLVKLEKGIKTNPSLDTLDKITSGLGINIAVLFNKK